MPTILDRIMSTKRQEIAAAKAARPERELRAALADAPPPRDFFAALSGGGPIKLIAEVKRASPSKGLIRADFDPVAIAAIYQQHGASCISVLTDAPYFQGSLGSLRAIRQAVGLPLLRKDFLLDAYQLLEAREAGADAVLLIAECLSAGQLRDLHAQALDLGLTPLVEFYDADNLDQVLAAGARLVGVNNRDLRSFHTDLQHTVRMRARVPQDCLLVGESGIHGRADAQLLEAAGVNAMLVGEHLMASPDIGQAVDRLLGRS
jgi:indole-3-glycerol phosphate synthase